MILYPFVDGCPDGSPEVIKSDEVLRSGLAGRPDLGRCKVKKSLVDAAKPEPGEILIFARPLPSP